MSENKLEILAGALVVAAAVGFVFYAGKSAGMGAGGDSYPLRASFRSIEGVSLGSDVKLAGVKVGTITGLTLNPTTYMADAVIAIDKKIQLPSDSAILISSEGLLGGNYVEIQPGGAPDNFAPGDQLMKFVGSKPDSAKSDAAKPSAPATPDPAAKPAP
jgi:phospholipid/cholesterol/gamma-HCH transport system substrate-binding protein